MTGGVVRGAVNVLRPADPLAAALTASSMLSSLSNGVFYTVSVLFFTRIVGFGATEVGAGLTVAGGAGVIAAFAAGHLADRVGAGIVLAASTATQGLALIAYTAAASITVFVVIASVAVAARAAQATARAAVLAQAFTGPERVLVRARLGVVINVFIGVGTVTAGLVLLLDTRTAYTTAMLAAGTLVLAATWPLLSIQRRLWKPPLTESFDDTPASTPAIADSSPLRDHRYLLVNALTMVLAMHAGLLTVGVPLWITTRTAAPPVTVALLMVANTVLVVAMQVPFARKVHNVRSAARSAAGAGVLLALACLVYATSSNAPAVAAVLLLLAAVTVHTFGEIAAEVGSWGLAFDLAPPRASGAYQAVNQTSVALGAMLAPIITITAVDNGTLGWIALAAIFAFAGLATLRATATHPDGQQRAATTG